MINMNSLKRVLPFAGAFLLAGALVGCGDDGNSNDPIDAGQGVPDGGDGTPDACVGGHGGGCVGSPFALPEHGEFRLEQFQYGPAGVDAEDDLAAQAFFFTDQEPLSRSLGGKRIEIRAELEALGYECQDFSDGNNFDNGYTEAAQAVINSRTYIDVGASATLTNEDDATDVITLDKVMDGVDLSASLTHEILYQGSKDVTPNHGGTYLPKVEGSLAYPELELGYGESAPGDEVADPDTGEGQPKIYMPSDFQMTMPVEEDFFAAEGLTFTKGQDLQLRYTIDAEETIGPDDFPTIISFIGFVNNGGVEAYCIKYNQGERDDGTFDVPYEVLEFVTADPEEPAQDDFNYILFGRFTHVAWEALNLADPARLDFLGVTCLISPTWQVNDAAAQ